MSLEERREKIKKALAKFKSSWFEIGEILGDVSNTLGELSDSYDPFGFDAERRKKKLEEKKTNNKEEEEEKDAI